METLKSRKKLTQLTILVILVAVTIFVVRQQRTVPYQHNEGMVFGTIYHITYQNQENLQKEIEKELQEVDASLSPFNENSIISKVNRNEDVQVDDMFKEVFSLARQISEETDGAFDITVAPLVNAWGFGFKNDVQPTKSVIDSLKEIVGYNKVVLSNGKVKKEDSRILLDCSAIAKGYGTDIVANFLSSKGVENFMVEIGGEIVTSGNSEKNAPWRIGISKPIDDSLSLNNEYEAVLEVTEIAMATSGNYRNFYYKDGKKYAHTINPKTGQPIQRNILSATVIAKDCATADGYATAFMVIGLDESVKILKRHPEVQAYFIYSDDTGEDAIWYSQELKEKICP